MISHYWHFNKLPKDEISRTARQFHNFGSTQEMMNIFVFERDQLGIFNSVVIVEFARCISFKSREGLTCAL